MSTQRTNFGPLFRSIGVLVSCGVVEEQGRGHGPALVRAKETAE